MYSHVVLRIALYILPKHYHPSSNQDFGELWRLDWREAHSEKLKIVEKFKVVKCQTYTPSRKLGIKHVSRAQQSQMWPFSTELETHLLWCCTTRREASFTVHARVVCCRGGTEKKSISAFRGKAESIDAEMHVGVRPQRRRSQRDRNESIVCVRGTRVAVVVHN